MVLTWDEYPRFPDFRPNRESGIPQFPILAESGIGGSLPDSRRESPIPGQIGNRGNGKWGFPGLSRTRIAGPTNAVCGDRYCSVPAECFRWRCTSRLALLHGAASGAWGATPAWSTSTQQWTWRQCSLISIHGPTAPPGSVKTAFVEQMDSLAGALIHVETNLTSGKESTFDPGGTSVVEQGCARWRKAPRLA